MHHSAHSALLIPARRLTCFALLVATAMSAVVSAERFEPKHIAKLQQVVSASISPDGSMVAYTKSVPRKLMTDPNGSSYTELHVVDLEGNTRPFITGKVSIRSIQWTPDGTKIAYVANRSDSDHSSLYIIPVNGGESQKIMEHDTSISSPVFNADGSKVAFLAKAKKPKELSEIEDHGFDQEIYEEDWTPTLVWIADVDDPKPTSLELPGSASTIEWSPSGKELSVALAKTSLVDDSYMFKRVHVVDAESGRIVERIKNPGKLGAIHWSPDGKHLAMISAIDINDPQDGRLMIASLPGDGELKDLMPKYEAHVSSFAWIDDEHIVWIAGEGTKTTVGVTNISGDSHRTPIDGPVLSRLQLAADGKTASVTGSTAEHPPEVFTMDIKSRKLSRLTTCNPWLSDMEFAEQETVTWKAEDGLELQGVLIKPLGYVEGRRYPMIMYVHGGPEAHVSDAWVTYYSQPGQVAAARGFVVFCPNYRGSTGRGVEFSKMGQSDSAGKEFSDLVDGIDALVETGLVDRDKVGITGGSYGGYASAWGSTFYSDRYAASVMFVGISNKLSKLGTTDIPEEAFLVHQRKRVWEDWDYFIDRSPIKYVERNQTPTLILHGKEDPRVHPSQSLELHRHLKTLGQAPVRLILYPGEGHGNRKAASRFDYNLRMLRWMEHFLMNDNDQAPNHAIDYEKALK